MSKRWENTASSDPAWRRQRLRVLQRDGYVCQIKREGCTVKATQGHHLVAWTPGTPVPDSAVVAACGHCNAAEGSPERANPEIPRPSWL